MESIEKQAEKFFNNKHPRDNYRSDQWVTDYDKWRKECVEFAASFYKQAVNAKLEEYKSETEKSLKGNAFKESHLSPTLVVDLEASLDILEDNFDSLKIK